MAITFAVRGDSTTARYSTAGSAGSTNGTVTVAADGGAIGGSSIQLNSGGAGAHAIEYIGRANFSGNPAFSVLIRWKPNYTGSPAGSAVSIFGMQGGWSGSNSTYGMLGLAHMTTGQLRLTMYNESGTVMVSSVDMGAFSPTAGTWYDICIVTTGDTTANGTAIWVNGAALGSTTPTASVSSRTMFSRSSIIVGGSNLSANSNGALGELVVWDSTINPASVTLTSGSGSLNGASRTAFVDVAALDALVFSDPGIASVKTGVSYTYAGASQTGTYDGSDRWTDPGDTSVKLGVAYKANSTTNNKTGSYDGSDRWTDPGATNVKLGVAYKANSTTDNKTGTYDGSDRWSDPGESNVKLGVTYKANSLTDNKTGSLSSSIPTAAEVAAAVRTELATELARIDVAVSSRNAVAPDNASIAAVKAKTDNLPSDPADESLIIAATDALAAGIAAIPTNPVLVTDARLDNLDAPVSGISVPDLTDTITKVDELHNIGGCDPADPMTATATSRRTNKVNLAISGDGVSETRVTRV